MLYIHLRLDSWIGPRFSDWYLGFMLLIACWVVVHAFFALACFFVFFYQITFLKKNNISGITSAYQKLWIQIRPYFCQACSGSRLFAKVISILLTLAVKDSRNVGLKVWQGPTPLPPPPPIMHAILIWKISLNFILYYIMNRAFILKMRDIKPQNNNYIDIKTMAYNSLVHPQCWMCISSLEPIHQRRYTQNWQVHWRAARISNDNST